MRLNPLSAFEDNYIWTLRADSGEALIVDPGDAAPVFAAADERFKPIAILLTHHHDDHIGGVSELLRRWPELAVIGPPDARIATTTRTVGDSDRVAVGPWQFEVLEIPGHTATHIAFHGHGHVFCGDTLFSLGCGRLFEGTPSDMLSSLDRLCALDLQTRICCGHEYTLSNAKFARAVDPDNADLAQREKDAHALRENGQPTLPVTLKQELATNPFLRIDTPSVLAGLERHSNRTFDSRVDAFAALRRWKDEFRA